MKTSTKLKALVRNLSKKSNVGAEILLRNFMLERFLERIAVSDYKHNFILKDGMLIAAMVGESSAMIDLWERYRKKYSYAADVTWEMAIGAVRMLAEKAD